MRGNPMEDVLFNPALINEEPLPLSLPLPVSIAQDDQVIGLMSAGWTNERHSTYISSMEASFVEQLYGHMKHGPDANKSHLSAQLHPENTWVRRFRPRGAAAVDRSGEASVYDYGSGTDSVQKKVHQTYGRVAAKTCAEGNLIGKSKEMRDVTEILCYLLQRSLIRTFLKRMLEPVTNHARKGGLRLILLYQQMINEHNRMIDTFVVIPFETITMQQRALFWDLACYSDAGVDALLGFGLGKLNCSKWVTWPNFLGALEVIDRAFLLLQS